MLRISAVLIAVLALTGATAVDVCAARAQGASTKGGFSMEKCVASCTQGGGRLCDKYCAQKRATRQ
jgi:hypothetical protein